MEKIISSNSVHKTDKDAQHVLINLKGEWSVKRSGAVKVSRTFPSKADAIRYARNLGKRLHTIVFIHDESGNVQKVENFEKKE